MEIKLDKTSYKVKIIRKNIRNMYLRVNNELEIVITANFLVSNNSIVKFISDNEESVIKMMDKQKRKNEKEKDFYLLGKRYEIVICSVFKEAVIEDNKIFISNKKELNKIYKDTAIKVFNERLKVCRDLIENIPFPELKIRKMKRKWGYCNKRGNFITLNLELIKYGIDEIDYVIIHELCHLVHFNHSASFWNMVKKYKPNYKQNKKVLNED
jgi:predicted metal-dependent hydrolase